VVYSIGADGRDQGGQAADPSSHIQGGSGDLVFGRLAASHWRNR
jgi:hypothetical protein